MKHKKGLAQKVLLNLVISMIISLILVLITSLVFKHGNKLFTDTECRTSVISLASLGHISRLTNMDLKCRVKHVIIKGDDKKKIMQELANQLADCWWKFGEGKYKFLPYKDKVYCVVCSTIEFEKKDMEISIDEFHKFMKENFIPDRGITYAQYLNLKDEKSSIFLEGHGNDEISVSTSSFSSRPVISTKDNYIILFVSDQDVSWWNVIYSSLRAGAGTSALYGITTLPLLLIPDIGPVIYIAGVVTSFTISSTSTTILTKPKVSWRPSLLIIKNEEKYLNYACDELILKEYTVR